MCGWFGLKKKVVEAEPSERVRIAVERTFSEPPAERREAHSWMFFFCNRTKIDTNRVAEAVCKLKPWDLTDEKMVENAVSSLVEAVPNCYKYDLFVCDELVGIGKSRDWVLSEIKIFSSEFAKDFVVNYKKGALA